MRAITLWQPWASLVAVGLKTVETRSWSTEHRGDTAIHAAKRRFPFSGVEAEMIRSLPLPDYRHLADHIWPGRSVDPELCDNYPLGAVLAITNLADVVPTDHCHLDGYYGTRSWARIPDLGGVQVPRLEALVGDLSRGRYGWLFADTVPFTHPVEARGRQGLWNWGPRSHEAQR